MVDFIELRNCVTRVRIRKFIRDPQRVLRGISFAIIPLAILHSIWTDIRNRCKRYFVPRLVDEEAPLLCVLVKWTMTPKRP